MVCKNCNSQVPGNSGFCNVCGAPVADARFGERKRGNKRGWKIASLITTGVALAFAIPFCTNLVGIILSFCLGVLFIFIAVFKKTLPLKISMAVFAAVSLYLAIFAVVDGLYSMDHYKGAYSAYDSEYDYPKGYASTGDKAAEDKADYSDVDLDDIARDIEINSRKILEEIDSSNDDMEVRINDIFTDDEFKDQLFEEIYRSISDLGDSNYSNFRNIFNVIVLLLLLCIFTFVLVFSYVLSLIVSKYTGKPIKRYIPFMLYDVFAFFAIVIGLFGSFDYGYMVVNPIELFLGAIAFTCTSMYISNTESVATNALKPQPLITIQNTPDDLTEKLTKYKKLEESGLITQEEFTALKRRLLGL